MAIDKGRKHSELGEIPQDWQLRLVGSTGDVCAGKALAAFAPGKMRPYLRTKNVFDGLIDITDVLYMPMSEAEFSRYELKPGDVLLNEGQSIELVGRCAMYNGEYPSPCAIQNQLIRFRAFPGTSASFATHLFRSCQARGIFAKIAMQTTSVAHLGVSRFQKLQLAWPPTFTEQEAIAGALSDADAWIESLEQLIAKKRQIKQGAMQELLTGKRRLPGFGGEWVIKRLGECLHASPGYGINAPGVEFDSRLPTYLRITDITEDGTVATNNRVSVSHADALDYALARNDIVFARTGASVGKTYLYCEEDGPMVFAGFLICAKINPHILDPDFLFAFTRTRKYWNWVRMMSMRSGQPGINGLEYASLEIRLPPSLEEQSAISKILSDQQLAISELESKLAKARQIKQAMMQELLTGRIRLVES